MGVLTSHGYPMLVNSTLANDRARITLNVGGVGRTSRGYPRWRAVVTGNGFETV